MEIKWCDEGKGSFFFFPFHVFYSAPQYVTLLYLFFPIIPFLKLYYFPFYSFPHLCRSFLFVTINRIFQGKKKLLCTLG